MPSKPLANLCLVTGFSYFDFIGFQFRSLLIIDRTTRVIFLFKMDGFPLPANIDGLETISFYPNWQFLDHEGNMVHTRTILVRSGIQPDGKRDMSFAGC